MLRIQAFTRPGLEIGTVSEARRQSCGRLVACVLALLLFLPTIPAVQAQTTISLPENLAPRSLVLEDIELTGTGRTPLKTVYKYLPLRPGQPIDQLQLIDGVRELRESGLFKEVSYFTRPGTERGRLVLVLEVKDHSFDFRWAVGNTNLDGWYLVPAMIAYDNPTGQLYDRESLVALARLCVKHGLWLISDEAYRELHYSDTDTDAVSVWGLTEDDVPGITGRRISIETSSKVWNACGLRIGGLVTDNPEFHTQAVAENTAGLCSNVIGQYIFGSLAGESHSDLQKWYAQQRDYYRGMLREFTLRTRDLLPGIIVSSPDASIYSVVDVRNLAPADFDALGFVLYCAQEGSVEV